MPVWERYDQDVSLLNPGDHVNRQLFHNFQADENFEASDVVAVDGIFTVITDTADLCGVRLIVAPEEMVSADITEDVPQPHSPLVWYQWYCAMGPMVFRLRSKRTIPPEHKLWANVWKARGASATVVRYGIRVLWVVKH